MAQQCKFFAQGRCNKGAACPFLHDTGRSSMDLDDPAASTPPRRVVGERRATADATVSQATRSFAIDCEFIKVRQGKGETLQTWEVTVSVGVVSEELETILYARVQAPPRTQVFDDAFARTQGKLEPDWTLGVRLEVAQALVRGLLEDGQSLLVGWQIAKDLEGLRLGELRNHARVLDLSERAVAAG